MLVVERSMRKSLIFVLAAIVVLTFSVASFAQFDTAMKKGEVVDLSLTVAMDLPGWWPVGGTIPYVMGDYNKWDGFGGPYWTRTHIFDSHVATHYDSPQHFIPAPGFDNNTYNDFVKGVLAEYESKYGPRPTSEISNEKVPITQFVGPLRVLDVTYLVGTAPKDQWAIKGAPDITVDAVKKYETKYGPIKAGDVVAFMSRWDKKYRKLPAGNDYAFNPLTYKSEGWPTPTPECVFYLADKGVKMLVTDGASMGDVTGKKAIMTHWAGLGCDPQDMARQGGAWPGPARQGGARRGLAWPGKDSRRSRKAPAGANRGWAWPGAAGQGKGPLGQLKEK